MLAVALPSPAAEPATAVVRDALSFDRHYLPNPEMLERIREVKNLSGRTDPKGKERVRGWFEYDLDVAQAGWYELLIEPDAARVEILIDGAYQGQCGTIGPRAGSFRLDAGKHTLRIQKFLWWDGFSAVTRIVLHPPEPGLARALCLHPATPAAEHSVFRKGETLELDAEYGPTAAATTLTACAPPRHASDSTPSTGTCPSSTCRHAALDGVSVVNGASYGRRADMRPVQTRDQFLATMLEPVRDGNGNAAYLIGSTYLEATEVVAPPTALGFPADTKATWTSCVVNPAGRHCLERWAQALAGGDARFLADGGNAYTLGQPLQREFFAEYRRLPDLPFEPCAGLTDPVAVRQRALQFGLSTKLGAPASSRALLLAESTGPEGGTTNGGRHSP
ncbi:MAG: hypothetical protein A3K19_05705 [Lentisphaerae bacterium RIFOXYB12_FULL_65_16]|nr:MAG: hypothetical protein A3K18_23745 [Lentisphaerae bacterium RIFOXYA12_64_32]OGV94405.1 MAG: hypothetical protein A3K19_05705 [Lentisphaerae bacterium RIFOXYB12_FULL_65_16]